jgi:hypothetical protein
MCGAPTALANVFPLRFPVLTGWANVWRAYGARGDSEGAGMKKSGVKPPHSKKEEDAEQESGVKPPHSKKEEDAEQQKRRQAAALQKRRRCRTTKAASSRRTPKEKKMPNNKSGVKPPHYKKAGRWRAKARRYTGDLSKKEKCKERLLGLGGRGRDGCAGGFFEDVDGVDGEIVEAFDEAARPVDFDPIDFSDGAETEMDAHVIVRDVARPAADFVDENARTGLDQDFCAEGVASGFVFFGGRGVRRSGCD